MGAVRLTYPKCSSRHSQSSIAFDGRSAEKFCLLDMKKQLVEPPRYSWLSKIRSSIYIFIAIFKYFMDPLWMLTCGNAWLRTSPIPFPILSLIPPKKPKKEILHILIILQILYREKRQIERSSLLPVPPIRFSRLPPRMGMFPAIFPAKLELPVMRFPRPDAVCLTVSPKSVVAPVRRNYCFLSWRTRNMYNRVIAEVLMLRQELLAV